MADLKMISIPLTGSSPNEDMAGPEMISIPFTGFSLNEDMADLEMISIPPTGSSPNEDMSTLVDREYRRHAGEVRRRNDGIVRAEPPPPRPGQAKRTYQAKLDQSRRKLGNGFNDDEDSDSDRDCSQGRVREEHEPSLTDSVAGPEKREGLILMQETRVEEAWVEEGNGESIMNDKQHLLRELRSVPEGRRLIYGPEAPPNTKQWPNTHVFQFQRLQMSHYLDEALCHDIADKDIMDYRNYVSKGMPRVQLLSYIIEEAETKFVLLWEQLVTPSERTVRAIVKSLWTQNTWKYGWESQLWDHINDYLERDEFAASYERWILDQLGFSFEFDVESGRLMIRPIRGWRESSRGKYLDAMKILSKSRNDEQLSQKYINWVCRNTSPDLIDSCCRRRLQQIQGARIREVLGLNLTKQEFCVDNESLSLFLIKDGERFLESRLSTNDRKRIGWYRNEYKFYRYELDAGFGQVFKVGLDGKLLALWTSRGEAYWADKKSGLIFSYDKAPEHQARIKIIIGS